MSKKVFLFGAGASYGSDTQGTPPLGEALFDALRLFNPDAWGTINGDLAGKFRADFENAMKLINPHTLAPLQRAMAAYFFQFTPGPANLYLKLANKIKHSGWTGAVCTLNYERLFELSLLQVGIKPFVGQPPAGQSGFELCLPHGCCHIFCESAKGMSSAVSFDAHAVKTNGDLKVIGNPGDHRARIEQDAFPPVMSYFEPQKRTTAGHSFIEGQRNRWRDIASKATTLVIIGVRVRPHDDHIWNPIASSPARVVYCGGPSGAPEYKKWAESHRNGRGDFVLKGYFRNEFDRICSEVGL